MSTTESNAARVPKKILVPYDGSRPSESALMQALMLAKNLSAGAGITLLNVVQEVILPPAIGQTQRFRSKVTGEEVTASVLAKELHQQMKEEVAKMLDGKKHEIQQEHGKNVAINAKVLSGYPADEITRYAEEENVDLIIIGNTGLSGVSRLKALGSVSRSVVEKAACPVMVVH